MKSDVTSVRSQSEIDFGDDDQKHENRPNLQEKWNQHQQQLKRDVGMSQISVPTFNPAALQINNQSE